MLTFICIFPNFFSGPVFSNLRNRLKIYCLSALFWSSVPLTWVWIKYFCFFMLSEANMGPGGIQEVFPLIPSLSGQKFEPGNQKLPKEKLPEVLIWVRWNYVTTYLLRRGSCAWSRVCLGFFFLEFAPLSLPQNKQIKILRQNASMGSIILIV